MGPLVPRASEHGLHPGAGSPAPACRDGPTPGVRGGILPQSTGCGVGVGLGPLDA